MLRTYYFVADDGYGQRGCFIETVKITLKEFREAKETRTLNGKRGFITKDYIAALCYVQD